MAKRRMLSIPIIETDSFYGLSTPAQALYLHLNLNADDDGVVDKVRLVVKMMNINRKYYKELIDGGYILDLSDGIAVITHWLLHNQIKKDRYVPGEHRDLIETNLKIEGFRYTKASADIFGDVCAPQESIVKDSIEKGSTDKGSTAEHSRGEERKEKNTLSLSYVHTGSASQNVDKPEYSLDSLTVQALKNNIRLYFMKKYGTMDTYGFIEHCEANNWLCEVGRPIVECYKDEIDRWMAAKK